MGEKLPKSERGFSGFRETPPRGRQAGRGLRGPGLGLPPEGTARVVWFRGAEQRIASAGGAGSGRERRGKRGSRPGASGERFARPPTWGPGVPEAWGAAAGHFAASATENSWERVGRACWRGCSAATGSDGRVAWRIPRRSPAGCRASKRGVKASPRITLQNQRFCLPSFRTGAPAVDAGLAVEEAGRPWVPRDFGGPRLAQAWKSNAFGTGYSSSPAAALSGLNFRSHPESRPFSLEAVSP